MFSRTSTRQVRIVGTQGLNAESIRQQVAHGAKFVVYSYNFSIVVMSFKRASNIYFVRAGQSRFIKGLPFTLFSLCCGWWGIPWGFIYTIQTLATNLGGGTDVTDRILGSLAPPAAPAPAATPSKPLPPIRSAPKASLYALAVGVIAAIAGLVYLGICYYDGQHLPVVLISGLPQKYDVSLNGQNYHLRPESPEILALPEGTFDLQGQFPGGQKIDQRVTLSTDFFSRPFKSHVAILNPDKAAVIYREATRYRPTGLPVDPNDKPTVTCFANESSYFLDKPDYLFGEFPKTISMPSDTSVVVKTRLDVLRDSDPANVASLLNERIGYAAMRSYCENQARLRPDDETVLQAIVRQLQPADAEAIFEGLLADRPVHIECHRYYQSLQVALHPDFDLIGQYRHLADAEPDNGDLLYLYARLISNRDISHPLYKRALEARHPCAYAAVALGFDEISDANFPQGLDLFLQAERAGVHSETLWANKRIALLALGRIQDVIRETNTELAASPENTEIFADLLRLQQSVAPDEINGRLNIANFLAHLRQHYGESANLDSVDKYLHAAVAYGAGNEAEFAHRAQWLAGSENMFETAVARRDHVAAAAALAKVTPISSQCYWILYLTAHVAGDEAAAQEYFQKGLDALPKEGRDGSGLAQLIKSDTPADLAKILRTSNFPSENCVLFTALGVRFPEQRQAYFERARLLDVDPAFPHLLLHSVFKTTPTAGHI